MKKIILLIIIIALIIFLTFIYTIFENNLTKINNIKENEKKEIISLMILDDYYDEINLEKMEIPKTHKDIYYKIYFSTSIDINITNIKSNSDLYLKFDKINDNQYSCTISNMGKSINMLEEIRNNY